MFTKTFWRGLLMLAALCGCEGSSTTTGLPKRSVPSRALSAAVLVGEAPEIVGDPLRPVGRMQSGAVVLARLAEKLYALIADADEHAVVVVDVDAKKELFRHGLTGRPEHLLLGPNGRLYVSVASQARVVQLVMRGERLLPRRFAEVPAEPTGMALTPDGKLLVASRWGAALSVLDADSLTLHKRITLPRDPYAVSLLEHGKKALVTHVVGGKLSVIDLAQGTVHALAASRVDHKASRRTKMSPRFPNRMSRGLRKKLRGVDGIVRTERMATQAFAATAGDNGRVFVSASLADGTRAPFGGEGYGGGGSSIRTHAGVELVVAADGTSVTVPMGTTRSMRDDCLLPRASVWDAQQKVLLVACVGTNSVAYFETKKHAGMLRATSDVPAGPTGITIDPKTRRWFVWSQFAGVLSSSPIATEKGKKTPTVRIAIVRYTPLPANVARGRALFHEAGASRRIAADGRACASCHPSARDDAMTWSTPEGPRQTPILMGRITDTAPFGWNGRAEDLDTHLQRTLSRLAGTGITKAQRSDLVAYLQHMESPMVPERDPELAQRGRELFTEGQRCSSCHPLAGQTTDAEVHDLGSPHKADRLLSFNTPTLRFVGRSAPYYHDGRYASLDALLADPGSGMGTHAELELDDRTALAAFLRTL